MTSSALLYSTGTFTDLPGADPVLERFMQDGCSVPELITRLEYTVFTSVRHQDCAPLGLTVYRRLKAPQWLVLLEAPSGDNGTPDNYAYVFCERLPDVMDLLAEWSPTLHNLSAAELSAYALASHETDD